MVAGCVAETFRCSPNWNEGRRQFEVMRLVLARSGVSARDRNSFVMVLPAVGCAIGVVLSSPLLPLLLSSARPDQTKLAQSHLHRGA